MDCEDIRAFARERNYPVMRRQTAELLKKVAGEVKPDKALEIGTCIGLSAITLLESCDCELLTVDNDPVALEFARKNFENRGLEKRVEILEEDCYDALNILRDRKFDFIILDGPKGHYGELFDILVPMLDPGGALFADDIGFHGMAEGEVDPGHKHRTIVRSIREFIRKAKEKPELSTEIYNMEDGVAVIRRKK